MDIEEAWLEIAFALLREAREMYDAHRWERFKNKIDRMVLRAPKYSDRCHYEYALWMIWNIRRSEAKEILQEWLPSTDTALARMQKAGLLVELEALEEAESLLRSALRHIRLAIHSDSGQNIYLLSLEGWCMYLLHGVVSTTDFSEWLDLYDEFTDRWQELKTWNCSPIPLLNYFQGALTENPPREKPSDNIVFEFDPGRRRVMRSLGGAGVKPWLPAFSLIRLYEQVGIPAFYFGSALTYACKWIIPFTSFWSPALLIRAGKADEMKKTSLLDRPRVAIMREDLAGNIYEWAIDALNREQARLGDRIPPMSFSGRLIEALFEVASRVSLRLDADRLRKGFSVAIQLHSEPAIYNHITLHDSCYRLFVRLFTAASDSLIHSYLPELIRFPLAETQKISNSHHTWRDPIDAIPPEYLQAGGLQSPEIRARVEDATDWLLDRARSESGEGWRRAVRRLITVYRSELMIDNQMEAMAATLWRETDTDGFPDLPGVFRYYFGHLPAPSDIDVISKVRSYLLNGIPQSSVTAKKDGGITVTTLPPDPMILDIAYASKPIVHVPYEPKGLLEWNRDETRELWSKIHAWWENDKRALESRPFFGSENIIQTVRHAGLFLRQALLPKMETESDDEWNEITAFLRDSRDHGVFLTSAWPYVLIHHPEDGRKVEKMVIDDLASDVEDAVEAAARSVRHWVHL